MKVLGLRHKRDDMVNGKIAVGKRSRRQTWRVGAALSAGDKKTSGG